MRHGAIAKLSSIAQLLGSGVIAAAGLTLIASNRIHAISGELAVFVLLFVQWETFGLLLAKTGIDQLVFAVVSANPRLHLRLAKTFQRRVLPIALAFGLICLGWFPPAACLALACSVVLDVYSVTVLAELNARKRHTEAAVANLLNYPVFIALLFVLAAVTRPDVGSIAAAFTASSVLRAAYLGWRRRPPLGAQDAEPQGLAALVAQPILNHLLFRTDQLCLPLAASAFHFAAAWAPRYLFLAKFPELTAGVLVAVGVVVLPELAVSFPSPGHSVAQQLGKGLRGLLLLASLPLLALGSAIYLAIWGGNGAIPLARGIPFLIHTLFILPANLLTFSMVVAGSVSALLRNLFAGICAGGAVLLTAAASSQWVLLSMVVPVQLAVFVGCCVFLGWGERRALFEGQEITPAGPA